MDAGDAVGNFIYAVYLSYSQNQAKSSTQPLYPISIPMTKPQRTLSTPAVDKDAWLHTLIQAPHIQFLAAQHPQPDLRLMRLDEINEDGHQAYQQALANVYASLDKNSPVRLVYMLAGGPHGVALYMGVAADANSGADVHEAMKNLQGALEGQLPGIHFGKEVEHADCKAVLQRLKEWQHHGLMLGTPTAQSDTEASNENNFQGLDRLARTLQSSYGKKHSNQAQWQITVVSQALDRDTVRDMINQAFDLSSQLAALLRTSIQASGNTSKQKSLSTGESTAIGSNSGETFTCGKNESRTGTTSKGKNESKSSSYSSSGTNSSESKAEGVGTNESKSINTGSSATKTTTENASSSDTTGQTIGFTQDLADKRAQHLVDFLDKQLVVRLQKGLTKGLYQTAVYVSAENQSTYHRLKNSICATFQGGEATLTPLAVSDLPSAHGVHQLALPHIDPSKLPRNSLFHSLHQNSKHNTGSLLTSDELAVVASLPQHELQGVRRRKTVPFIVDLPDVDDTAIDLGAVIDRGRCHVQNPVRLARNDLNKHVFVTGVTGAGKTTTCLQLLLQSDLPFLVIEPAKTEYRELAQHGLDSVDFYRPNGDPCHSLRINPFALLRKGQNVKSHAGFLKNLFSAVFPLEASMPMMIEDAILRAYEAKGWDLEANHFESASGLDPFDPLARAWPTMGDFLRQLDALLPTYELGREFEEKYRGSLISRLRSMTNGTLGSVLDVPQSLDFRALLNRKVVIELEELQGAEEKALMMALILGCMNEAIRAEYAIQDDFRHLTLIEEAHRLLARPEPGDKNGAMAIEAFANMLAEVRKYGEGLIIADQIPSKLIPDVIKNTHTKIVHRLYAEDDRRAVGEAMMMSEEQRSFLPNLGTGEAVLFCGGWHGPAHARISQSARTDNSTILSENALQQRWQQQLWNERSRYSPELSQLPWCIREQATPENWARFLQYTRKAMRELTRLPYDAHALTTASKHSLSIVQAWQRDFLSPSEEAQHAYALLRNESSAMPWPERLDVALYCAALADSNPKTKTEKAHAAHKFDMQDPSIRAFLQVAAAQLLEVLPRCSSLEEFCNKVARTVELGALKNHLESDLHHFSGIQL